MNDSPDSWTRRRLDTNDLGAGLIVGDMDSDGDPDIIINGKWYENLGVDMITGDWPEHVYDANPLTVTYVRVGDGLRHRPRSSARVARQCTGRERCFGYEGKADRRRAAGLLCFGLIRYVFRESRRRSA